ncbi:MAG: hypothetical protein KDH92_06415 [Chloroflexi bacterium]|nr:hypothetical protein [Chloroflexota bacterium]
MRLHPQGLPIRVRCDEGGRPLAFTHAGQTYQVSGVEDVREPHLDWWSPAGAAHRIYYLLTTQRGMICEIFEDRAGGGWFLARVYD